MGLNGTARAQRPDLVLFSEILFQNFLEILEWNLKKKYKFWAWALDGVQPGPWMVCTESPLRPRISFQNVPKILEWNPCQRVEAPSGGCPTATPSQPWNLPGRGFYSIKIESPARELIRCHLAWAQKVGVGIIPGHNLTKNSATWAEHPKFRMSFSRYFLAWTQKHIVDGHNSFPGLNTWKLPYGRDPKT